MTGQDIYEIASSMIYERSGEDADSQEFSVPFLNITLQECLDVENSIRRYKGRAVLIEAPYITALSETIDYDGAITRVAMPYALASHFYREAMDNYNSQDFRARFISALNDARKHNVTLIEDVYGGV